MTSPTSPQGGQTIKLTDLTLPQLSQLKKQLDTELETLTTSFAQLKAAQSKFRDCLSSLSKGLTPKSTERTILVPLTSSLYVPGKLADTENVIVDVGTGFYVEKSKEEAKEFYERKIAEIQGSLGKLEAVVNGKGENLRVVEEVMRVKILRGEGTAGSATAAAA